MVQFRSVAVLDSRLAGSDRRSENVLSDHTAHYRLRHHFLLGRTHDDVRLEVHEGCPVQSCLHHRNHSRCRAPKMSKSKGNVVDPLEICDRFGTDAVRFALARMGAPGTDIAVSDELLDSYRAFATKIWNAARFIFRQVDEADRLPSSADLKHSNLALVDRWVLSRLACVTETVNRSIELYNLHEAARHVYDFFKHEFCDWYLEMIKLDPERSKPVLLYVFETALRLLHPFMPFITEELWQNLPHKGDSIVIAAYPEFDSELVDERAESQTELLQEIVVKVRNIRAEMNVDARQTVPVRVATTDPELSRLLS